MSSSGRDFLSGGDSFVIELARNQSEVGRQSHDELRDCAYVLAERMRASGWARRRVILCLPNGLEFVQMLAACLLANVVAVPASLARTQAQFERLLHIAADAQACAIIIPRGSAEDGELRFASCPVLSVRQLRDGHVEPLSQAVGRSEGVAFIQYTSGSTSAAKGVEISLDNLRANVQLIAKTYQLGKSDILFSWLPLFHDMGLVGFAYQSLYLGNALILTDPFAFIQKPLRWLQGISKYHATASAGPNFAYKSVIDRVAQEQLQGLDLSSWRIAINGAEPISAGVTAAFCEKLAPIGFRKEAMIPSYGLAEATLLVTAARVGEGIKTILHHEDAVESRRSVVSSGYLNEVVPLRIARPDSAEWLADGVVGEVLIGGPCLFERYIGASTGVAASFVYQDDERYFRTGDLGFIRQGELFILGRVKDLIILRGRNIYPGDVEDVIGGLIKNHKPNSAVAFGFDACDREELVVMIELAHLDQSQEDLDELESIVRRGVGEKLQIYVDHVVFVRPNTIIKTSSGKPQRVACKELYRSSEIQSFLCQIK